MGKHDRRPRPKPLMFVEGKDTYAEFLPRLHNAEKARHKSLIDVIVLRPEDEARPLAGEELYARYGLKAYQQHKWLSCDANEGYSERTEFGQLNIGGCTNWLIDQYEKIHTVIFMRHMDGGDEAIAAANLAMFIHEVGHVDDFEKRVNFVVGDEVDMESAEAYAHTFALNQLRKRNLKHSLGFYLGFVIPQLKEHPAPSVARAASGAAEVPGFDEICMYAKDSIRTWESSSF